jgi:phytoene dehydrogenase-like protein
MAQAIDALQDLNEHVQTIEAQLHGLDEALREQDAANVEAASACLHRALADALASFRRAQKAGAEPLPQPLRHRLMLAQTRVAGLQQTLLAASSSMERTLSVLLPRDESVTLITSSNAGPRTPTAAALNAYRG